ncbi:hypothetical protein HN604_03590 [archaeon]|jgi:hypothetical protein|nr:hypothetical protein [archaeon]MBT6182640.1 hypothetical protein [archaeon]MBT6606030.1 hypothetical protein [archaeon]MBT7251673.1 hypothetical protein [archaeon]MBT7661136.1 hypothetical protein [archaeon]
MAATISAMSYFLPIFSFLLVFIVVYALLMKTKVLGDNATIAIFISLILASFFVVEASLVEFIQFSSAWFGVIVVAIFFLVTMVAFLPGEAPLKIFEKGLVGWVVVGLMVAFFIVSSAYVFNWAISWGYVRSWFDTEWFGMILLLVIAAIVSFTILPKAVKG